MRESLLKRHLRFVTPFMKILEVPIGDKAGEGKKSEGKFREGKGNEGKTSCSKK